MLKLKLQYFGHLMRRVDSLEKTLMLGGIEARGKGDDRGWDGWMASPTRRTWVWVNSGSWWWTGRPDVLQFMGSQRVGHDWETELNWTDTVFHSGYINLHSHQQCKSVCSLFSTPSPAFIVCRLFDDGCSDWCKVTSHCGFDLHFSNNERCWSSFHVFVSHLYVFFGDMSA